MKTAISLAAALALSATAATAADYILQRAVIILDDGVTHDSAMGDFQATGRMSVIGNRILQDGVVCLGTACDSFRAAATILSVAPDAVRVTIRNDNGLFTDMTLLSLWPNIITLTTHSDGTIETNQWATVQGFVRNETPDEGVEAREASVGRLVK